MPLEFRWYHVYVLIRYTTFPVNFRLMAVNFDFQNTQTSYSILTSLSEIPYPKTWVKKLEVCCDHEHELRHTWFSIYFRSIAAIFDLQTSDSIPTSLPELPDPKNIGIAVVYRHLSCLQGEISIVPFWRPLSWTVHFRLDRAMLLIVQ